MTQKSFEDFLKSKAEEFKPQPNIDNWDKIAAALPPEKKKKRLLIWIPIGIAASIAALSYGIYASKPSSNIVVGEKTVRQNVDQNNATSSDSKSQTSITTNSESSLPTIPNSSIQASSASNKKTYFNSAFSNDAATTSKSQSKTHNDRLNEQLVVDKFDNKPFFNHIFDKEPKLDSTNLLKLGGETHYIGLYNSDTDRNQLQLNLDTSMMLVKETKNLPSKDSSLNLKTACILMRQYPHRLAFNFTPLYINTILSQPNNIGTNSIEYNNRKNEDKAKFSFNTGLTYVYKKRKHAYSIGVQYTQLSYSMYVTSVTYSPSLSTINRVGNFNYAGDSFITTPKDDAGGRVTNTYRYLSIPITYTKYIFDNSTKLRNKFAMQFGLNYNRLISQTGLLNQSNGVYVRPNSSEVNNITKQQLSIRTGIEINQILSHRSLLFVAPFYQRSLSAIEKGSISTSYGAWGLSFGIQFKIK